MPRRSYAPRPEPEGLSNQPAPYVQSRAALRSIYGTRRIDARAPQSAMDTTPSGMAARNPGQSDLQKNVAANSYWRTLFPQARPGDDLTKPVAANVSPAAPGDVDEQGNPIGVAAAPIKPFDFIRQRQTPQSPLEAIRNSYSSGATSGRFTTPYGPVSYGTAGNVPSLMPTSGIPIASVSDYVGNMRGMAGSDSLFPSIAPKAKPSILDGASDWLQNV